MDTNDFAHRKTVSFYMSYAFLGAIRSTVRGIAFNYSDNTIRVDVYYDSKPLDDDYDIISLALTYLEADMPEILGEELNLIECHDKNINPTLNGKEWFYLRYENDDDENI